MRKIIKGKVYDTDTAHMMGSHAGVYMFKKKTGEYFKATESAGIEPQTQEEAKQWFKSYLDADTYNTIFGGVEVQEHGKHKMKKIREMTGYTQEEFAEAYEIPISTIKSWELGHRLPPGYVLNLLEFKVNADFEKNNFFLEKEE